MLKIAVALVLGVPALLASPLAQAFAEDLCPSTTGASGWGECFIDVCRPGADVLACETVSLISTFVGQVIGGDGVRSSVHFDSTYYLAQAAGLSARDAYTVATYSQVPDVRRYVHLDQAGALMADPELCSGASPPPECVLSSLVVDGMERNNFEAGGVFYHFMAPFESAGAVEGLTPHADDPQAEPQLSHVRRWLYGGSPLCVAGLTAPVSGTDYAHGTSCYQSTTREKSELLGRIPLITELGVIGFIDWLTPLGEQTVITDPVSGLPSPASALDAYFPPEQAPLVRLGLYLHALADRISHHRCNVASGIQGPRPADAPAILTNPLIYPLYQLLLGFDVPGLISALVPPQLVANPEFFYEFDTNECDQLSHSNRHTWETGTNQRRLPPEDQTTAPSLAAMYDEIVSFRQFYLLQPSWTLDATGRQKLLDGMLKTLEAPDAPARFEAFCERAADSGWIPLPGYCGLSFADWDAKAGIYSLSAAPDRGGGNFGPWLSLPLLAALALRCARRRCAPFPAAGGNHHELPTDAERPLLDCPVRSD